MAEDFPAAPRMPRFVRLVALAIGLAAVALATRNTITSLAWLGRTFPGFMVLDNRVIASVGLPGWSGQAVPGLYQSQILAVDGEEVGSREEINGRIAATAPGTAVRYRVVRNGRKREVTIPTQTFTGADWTMLFGIFLLNGAIFIGAGLVVWTTSGPTALAASMLAFTGSWAFFMLTAMDLYGPASLFRVHAGLESLLAATVLQFTLLFPQPHRWARWRFADYPIALASLLIYETFLYTPAVYSRVLEFNMLHLGGMGVLLGARLVGEYWRGGSRLARERTRMVTIGAIVGLALPGMLGMLTAFGGGRSINVGAMTPPLFVIAIAYAVVKHDVFEIDAMVKRGAYYLVVTGAVGGAYVGAILLFNLLLRMGAVTDSPAFPVLFTLVVLVVFNPLRTKLQTLVDRVFFRTPYDATRVLAAVGVEIGSALKVDEIARIVRRCVDATIPNTCTGLFVRADEDGGLREAGGLGTLQPALATQLERGRLLTAYDAPELYADAATHAAVRAALTVLDAELAVPLQLGGKLMGALTVGRKRSGLFHTAGDAEFLRALAHEAAIALQNAASYEALAELNAELEGRVRERTAQLVQSERLASLGRLVAGVAHEINNPVSFVASSIVPLRDRLEELAAIVPAAGQEPLREAGELVDIMARGAERTVAIVKDLRAFSRLGEEERKPADLHEGLDVTLRLLEARWRDRITIERDYGELPRVECNPGQMNQVFMNLVTNACDAIAGSGTIRVSTRVDGHDVRIAIHDDGCGIPADVLPRIFDPFFTTKDVGAGTGLGLSISHGVVSAHGGRIEVTSAPGGGTTFEVVLPVGRDAAGAVQSRRQVS